MPISFKDFKKMISKNSNMNKKSKAKALKTYKQKYNRQRKKI